MNKLFIYKRIKSKVRIILFCFFILFNFELYAQLKVGSNPSTINSSSLLELESTDKGLLLPRLALSSTLSPFPLISFIPGMLVYNTATAGVAPDNVVPGYYLCKGDKWLKISTSESSWNVNGNDSIDASLNFIGTRDNNPLVFKTNNLNRLVLGNSSANSFTNVNASSNLNSSYANGSLIAFNNILDAQNGTQGGSLLGIENLLYLRSGSSLNSGNGTMRGIRNRLWNVQTSNYPNVQGVFNDYRGEVTDVSEFKGFSNYMDLRSGSDISSFFGFINEFNQFNGTITNYYGFSNYPRQASLNNYSNYYGFFQSNLGNTTSRFAFYYDGTASGTSRVVVNAQGRIGLGTTTPQAAIEIDIANPLKMNTVSSGTKTDELLSINSTGMVRKVPMVDKTIMEVATLSLPSGNGVIRHNYDIGLSSSNAIIFKITGTNQQYTITGITGGTDGRIIKLFSSSTNGNLVLNNEDTNSQAANRIRTLTGGNINTNNDGIISLYYDGTIERWIVLDVYQ